MAPDITHKRANAVAKSKSEKKPTVIGGYTMPPKEETPKLFTVCENSVVLIKDEKVVITKFKSPDAATGLCDMLNAAYQLFKEGDRASGLDAPVVNVKEKKAKKEKVA